MTEESRPGPADFHAIGLYDPDAPDAATRLALLEYLVDIGATLDDLASEKPDELPVLASTIALWPTRERLTLHEVAERAELDPELVARVWRAAGFPEPPADARVFAALDVEMLGSVGTAFAFFGEEAMVSFVRVLGAAALRVADAAVSTFVVNVGQESMQVDPSGLELARANATSTAMLPALVQGFDALLRHRLELERRSVEVDVGRGVEVQHRSVGFVDLVDSTALAHRLDARALATALTEFDAVASEIVVASGARVVKLIGDEIMFVAAEADRAVNAALALIDAFAAHSLLPPVRGAVATGNVLARDGDYSGVVVNLASRAAKQARPGTVLADGATKDLLAVATRDAGEFVLKGFDEPIRLYRVTPDE